MLFQGKKYMYLNDIKLNILLKFKFLDLFSVHKCKNRKISKASKVKLTFIGRSGTNRGVFYLWQLVWGCQLHSLMHMCKNKRGVAYVR